MKIMLVNPSSKVADLSHKYRKFVTPILPIGIAYIAAVLERNGFEVIIIDQYANRLSNKELLKKIRDYAPQVIGFSCLTLAMSNVRALVEQIKLLGKDIKIVLGNIHATVFADELLRQGLADIIVRGEGEMSMLDVVSALKEGRSLWGLKGISFAENGEIYHNPERDPIENLDMLPYPAWHLLDLKLYKESPLLGLYEITLPVQGSRGCPYQCIFCSQVSINKWPRYRQIKKIVDEIEYAYENFKIKHFGFIDAFFPFSIKSGLEFCDELIRRRLHKKIRWVTETRVDKVNLELLKRMKEAGLFLILYGFEVGNETVLKSIKSNITLEQDRKTMRETKKADIFTLGLFMLGLPAETRQTCEETIEFAKELDCDIAKFNIAVPFPGSQFFNDYRERLGNLLQSDRFTSWSDWSCYSGDLNYTPEEMTSKELINLQRKAMFEFYMRPKLIMRHIMRRTITLKNLCYGAHILISNYIKNLIGK